MMGFQPTRGGYLTYLNNQERGFLAGLARDVIYMLGYEADREVEIRAGQERDANSDSADASDAFSEWEKEFIGVEDAIADDAEERFYNAMTDPMRLDDAIARLLPDMSEEPELADELRQLTEDAITQGKVDNLVRFYSQIKPNNFNGDFDDFDNSEFIELGSPQMRELLQSRYFFLSNDDVLAWMGALNDIRLVLSARLEITDDLSAQKIMEHAARFTSTDENPPEDLPFIEEQDDMLAVMYAMTSWWLDTLATSMLRKQHRRFLGGNTHS